MICARCGTVFCVEREDDQFWLCNSHVLYCSPRCKKRSQAGEAKHRKELGGSPRKIRRQVTFIRKRDGDNCWLCGLPIDFEIADHNDPMHCSRDHVIPRGRGGDLSIANMRLAHRKCNTERGHRIGDQARGLPASP